jgi:hypothetical protein
VCVHQNDQIYDESDCDHNENNANREDSLSNSQRNNLSEPKPTGQSKITAMAKMIEEPQENQLHPVDQDAFTYH